MHLSAGALISLLVIFFSVTGALLAYERPIVRAADEHSYRIDPSRQQIRLPLDALMALVTAALPAPVEMVTTHQDPHPQPPGRGMEPPCAVAHQENIPCPPIWTRLLLRPPAASKTGRAQVFAYPRARKV
jgi:hypothetical protein